MLHKALEGAVILETFPKTTVDVFALVLESGGSMSVFLFFFSKFFCFKIKIKKWQNLYNGSFFVI
jgi:hypothetical protein